MSLRSDKKRRTRNLIIENAIAFFRERGFDAVRVKEIAAASDVSEGTFFNYFQSKDALVGEWVHGRLAASLRDDEGARGPGALRRATRSAARSLAGLLEADRDLLADLWPRARLAALRGSEPSAVVQAVASAQEEGEVRRDVPAEELARLLEVALLSAADGWLSGTASSAEDPAAPALLRAVDLVLDGSRRRNERVRVSRASERLA